MEGGGGVGDDDLANLGHYRHLANLGHLANFGHFIFDTP